MGGLNLGRHLEQNNILSIGMFSIILAIVTKYFNVESISYLKLVSSLNESFENLMVGILKVESYD